jgi:hypothetical protein
MVNFSKSQIVVTIDGERDDYTQLIKSMLFLMGNQNPDYPPDVDTLFTFCKFLTAMMPEPEQLV